MSRQRLSLPRFGFRRDGRSSVVIGALGAAAWVLVIVVLPVSAAPGLQSAAGTRRRCSCCSRRRHPAGLGLRVADRHPFVVLPRHHWGVVHQPELLCGRRQRWERVAVQRAYLVTAGEHRHEHVRLHIGLLCDLEILRGDGCRRRQEHLERLALASAYVDRSGICAV